MIDSEATGANIPVALDMEGTAVSTFFMKIL